jgi:hypothetical protein
MTPQQIEAHAAETGNKAQDEHEGKWMVNHGCHRHTINSRDSTVVYKDSLEECRQYIREQEDFYRSIGYCIWYAYAVEPVTKKRIELHRGNSVY